MHNLFVSLLVIYLQDYLMEIQKNPIKSKFCKLRLLCRTLAGNNVYYLTVTTPVANEEIMKVIKLLKCILIFGKRNNTNINQ